MKIFLIIIIII